MSCGKTQPFGIKKHRSACSACPQSRWQSFRLRRPMFASFARCKRKSLPAGGRKCPARPREQPKSPSLLRGQPPPHPLAPRAFAFAWQGRRLRGQTRRAQSSVPLLLRTGCLYTRFGFVRLPLSLGTTLSIGCVFVRLFRHFHHPIRTTPFFQA